MIPEAISQRLARVPRRSHVADPPGVRIGEVRTLAAPGMPTRLALVLHVDRTAGTAQVTLLHPYTEYATEHDLVAAQRTTTFPYDIVVQTDIRGTVSLTQLHWMAGDLPLEVVEACYTGLDDFVSTPYLHVGAHLSGPLDARWDFKVREGRALASLAAECTKALLDGERPWSFEVDEVFRALHLSVPNRELMILELYTLAVNKGRTLLFTLEHLELLDEQGLLDPTAWADALGDQGIHLLMSLVDHARSTAGQPPTEADSVYTVDDLVTGALR